jgi:hypothetical protein
MPWGPTAASLSRLKQSHALAANQANLSLFEKTLDKTDNFDTMWGHPRIY